MGWRRLAGLSLGVVSILFGLLLIWVSWRALGDMRDTWPAAAVREDADRVTAAFQAAVGLTLVVLASGQFLNQVRGREALPPLGSQVGRLVGAALAFIAFLALMVLTMTLAAPAELACPRPALEINTGPADTAPPTIACVRTLLGAAMDVYGLPSFLFQLGLTAFALAVGLRLLLPRTVPETTLSSAALAALICVRAVVSGELPRAIWLSLGVVALGIAAMIGVSLAYERLRAKRRTPAHGIPS